MKMLLRHSRGELGPKTVDEWAVPNGDDSLLIWMLRRIEEEGGVAELVTVVAREDIGADYYEEVRP